MNEAMEMLKLLAPFIVLEVALKIFCLVSLKKDKVKYLPKIGWVLVIVLINTFGSIAYLIFGRQKY
ncbi:Phospholipase_D-nuclease N-terminal [Clostridium amylolyticum]|uniref:Phospholipase_D-nuclease N-terminal n=1 Tax=Clostridium amylolyticum TaxID=1121298 RepID=A0A1M6LK05_9CLOT|nr:PLD nuclease N-terminal domain-containing protein [Clostridium amylolyticum]SHJ71537.1 Phospholipase_D-nuclease N-terminal [Clostridium amylolyticum]